ncbi:MAG: tyrosine-type recombinase/integrase [Candidatus Acidiferrum sp.]
MSNNRQAWPPDVKRIQKCRKIAEASGRYRTRDAVEELADEIMRPIRHGWHAFRRGLATNLHRLGVSDKVIQQILRHANVSTTMNIYVKTVSADATNAILVPGSRKSMNRLPKDDSVP